VFTVYKHTNGANGKAYVGYTKLTIEARWCGHVYDANHGSKLAFHRAIRKYGTDVWAHEVLVEGIETKNSACDIERTWIANLGTQVKNVGYNRHPGGEGGTMNPDVRKRQAAKLRGRPASNRRPVAIINDDGNIVHVFASLRAAQLACNLGSGYAIGKWCGKMSSYKHRGFYWRYADGSIASQEQHPTSIITPDWEESGGHRTHGRSSK
jgi:hypothetical protein